MESHIDGDQLIRMIRDDFKMTIDIVKMIEDVDDVGFAHAQNGNKEIEFGEFKQLLDTNDKEASADGGDQEKDIDEFFEI